jgi:DNA-binding transcriptional ArsR family regulator
VRGPERAGALIVAAKPARPALSREALELIAQRFRVLGDATRLALLQALFERQRTVQELCALTGASQANASKHLALLLEQGLVARRRDGLFTRYWIADPTLERLCRVVCGSLAERHEAVRAHLAS